MAIEELRILYDGYVDGYRGADGKLPDMMQLKRIHTAFVVKNQPVGSFATTPLILNLSASDRGPP